MNDTGSPIDVDFAHEVLTDLYRYRRKRKAVAWLLWAVLGLLGAHRFYLRRDATAALMLLTGGGALIWWLIDAFWIGSFVHGHNAEQARREQAGLPPLELDFMPPLCKDVLREPPAWTVAWRARGKNWRRKRFAGDIAVLTLAGFTLGSLVGIDGAVEAIVAIVIIAAVTALAGSTAGMERFPVFGNLLRWSHRLRLFYYYNEPGSPLALLVRPITGPISAPFRKRARAEVRLYLDLGFVFTIVFLLFDVGENVLGPLLTNGGEAISLGALARIWLTETATTFVIVYAFAAPIGSVLTLYLLLRPAHTVPRLLAVLSVAAILMGIVVAS